MGIWKNVFFSNTVMIYVVFIHIIGNIGAIYINAASVLITFKTSQKVQYYRGPTAVDLVICCYTQCHGGTKNVGDPLVEMAVKPCSMPDSPRCFTGPSGG